jgi:hypothetical protein
MDQFDPLKMGVSFEQFSKAMQEIAPAIDEAWQQIGGDEMLWAMRVDGDVYRQTPVLGRFRWYRRLRVW